MGLLLTGQRTRLVPSHPTDGWLTVDWRTGDKSARWRRLSTVAHWGHRPTYFLYFRLFYLGLDFSRFNFPYIRFRSKRKDIEKNESARACVDQRQLNMKSWQIDLKTSIIIENTRKHFETIDHYWEHDKSFPPRWKYGNMPNIACRQRPTGDPLAAVHAGGNRWRYTGRGRQPTSSGPL